MMMFEVPTWKQAVCAKLRFITLDTNRFTDTPIVTYLVFDETSGIRFHDIYLDQVHVECEQIKHMEKLNW